jgi:DNA-directed RNA polymerase subunit RPC12/RpoP
MEYKCECGYTIIIESDIIKKVPYKNCPACKNKIRRDG